MGLFSSSDSRDSGGSGGFSGRCRQRDCDTKVSGKTAKEATVAAMKHAEDKHGDKHLGFRWK